MARIAYIRSVLLCLLAFSTGCTMREISPAKEMTVQDAKRIIADYQEWKSAGVWNGDVTDEHFDDYYWVMGGAIVSPYPLVVPSPGGGFSVIPRVTGKAPDREGVTRIRYAELGRLRKYYSARNILTPFCLFILGPVAHGFADANDKVDVWHPNWRWFLPMWFAVGWKENERLTRYAEALELMRRRAVP